MGYMAIVPAKDNVAQKVLSIDESGLFAITINPKDAIDIVTSYFRVDAANPLGKVAMPSAGYTKYTGESIYDGDILLHLPIEPGSVRLTTTGVPTLIDRDKDGTLRIDRVVGSVLTSGSDGITSVPGTRTLTSAVDFVTLGVVAGDQVVISSGYDKGVYTVATVATHVLTLSTNFPTGSQTAATFYVYAVEMDCGSIDYFTGRITLSYPSSPSTASPGKRGTVLGTVATPVVLANNDTLTVAIDGGAPTTATFTGVAAQLDGGAGTFAAPVAPGDSVSIKINNETTAQVITMAGTENTIQKYIDRFNALLVGGFCEAGSYALPSMMAYLNELLGDYNTHMANVAYHDVADSNTAAGNATDLPTAITLANSLRTNYKAHMVAVSEEEEAVTLANNLAAKYEAHRILTGASSGHLAADATNIVNPALIPCATFATAVSLAAELKTRYNAHRAAGTWHSHADTGNEVTSASPATTIAELKTLLNEIKTDYNAHLLVITQNVECWVLANEIYLDYALHRATAGDVMHLVADAVNIVNPGLFPAIDVASAILLAADIRTCYKAHRSQAGVHANNDAGNDIAGGAPATLADTITVLNQAKAAFNAHRVVVSELEEAYTLLNEMQTDYELHRASATYHSGADAVNTVGGVPIANSFASACTLAGALAVAYQAHRSQLGVHVVNDAGNALITTVTPATMTQLRTMANDLRTKYNDHLLTASRLEESIAILNELRGDYEAHRLVTGGGVHGQGDDVSVVNALMPAASDVPTCKALADEIKARYEAHRIIVGGHTTGAFGGCEFTTHRTGAWGGCTLTRRTTGAFGGCRFTALITGPWGACAFVAPGGGVGRITDGSNPFVSTDVGRQITVTNAFTGANDGTFTITAVAPGGGSCDYVNAGIVAEAFVAATVGTFVVTRTAIIDASNPFTASDIGRNVVVTNSTTPANNGTFAIVAVDAAGGSADYVNAGGVSEVFAAATVGTLNSVRLADATTPFSPADVGRTIVVSGPTTPANAGPFVITNILAGGAWCDYTSAVGVTEPFIAATTGTVITDRTTGAFGGCGFTLVGGNVTLADASNPFIATDLGRFIVVRNATTGGNNGVYLITAVAPGGGSITYANGGGGTEAFAATTIGILNNTTILDTSNPFLATDVGKDLVITNSTTGANNGTYVVLARTVGTCDYANINAVNEVFGAATVGTIANVHGVADPVNIVNALLFPCPSTELGVALAANELKEKYNDHHVLALGVHGIADPGNTTASPDAGTAGVHCIDDTVDAIAAVAVATAGIHLIDDTTNVVTSDNADTLAVHKADDTVNPSASPAVGTAAIHKYDDTVADLTAAAAGPGDMAALQTLVADLYVKYPTHIANATVHKIADNVDVVSEVPSLLHFLSDRKGSSSKVEITAGTATLLTRLGLTAPSSATGVSGSNVSNLAAVLGSECETIVEAAVGVGNVDVVVESTLKVRMSSSTVNLDHSSRILIGGTARTKFGLDNSTHYGDDSGPNIPTVAQYNSGVTVVGKTVVTHYVGNAPGQVLEVWAAAKDGTCKVQVEAARR